MKCFIAVLALVSCLAAPGIAGVVTEDLTTASLDRPIYFHTPGSGVLQVPAGEYRVTLAGDGLDLTGSDGSLFAVQASWGTHAATLQAPLAVSLEGEADLDGNHFVVLMLPGGSSLEAAGNDTGVFARGLGDMLKKTAGKVGAAATNAAQTAGTVAGNVAGKVGGAIETAAGKVGTAVQTVGTGALALIIQFLQDIGNLVTCMLDTSDSSPGALGTYLQKFRDDGPDGLIQYILEDQRARMEGRIEILIGPDLRRLERGEELPGLRQLVDESFGKFELLCQDRKITRCTFEFLKPSLGKLGSVAIAAHAKAEEAGNRVFEKTVAPSLASGIAKILGQAIDPASYDEVSKRGLGETGQQIKDAFDWEQRAVNSGLYLQSLTIQLQTATQELQAARLSGDKAQVTAAIATTGSFAEDAHVRFALGVVRHKGHSLVGKLGEKLVLSAVGLLESAFATGNEVANAAAGAIPEVGGAAKAVVDTPRHWLWNSLARPALVAGIMAGIHAGWDASCTKWEENHLGAPVVPTFGQSPSIFLPMRIMTTAVTTLITNTFELTDAKLMEIAAKNRPEDSIAALAAYNEQLTLLVADWKP